MSKAILALALLSGALVSTALLSHAFERPAAPPPMAQEPLEATPSAPPATEATEVCEDATGTEAGPAEQHSVVTLAAVEIVAKCLPWRDVVYGATQHRARFCW